MTDSLNTPEQKKKTLGWLQEFHSSSDSLDAKSWVSKYFTNDAVVQFANSPIIKAHGPFIEIQDKRLEVLDEMKHEVVSFDIFADKIFQVARISYKVKGDPTNEIISIPGLAVFYKTPQDFKINRFDVYIDISPVSKRIQEVAASKASKE